MAKDGNNDTDILVKTLLWILQQKNDIFNLQLNIIMQNVKIQQWVTSEPIVEEGLVGLRRGAERP